ncbi:uncharacterized protein [Argopecten irradians]|uniref:uncharacterized protein n=1 Tax=Argopecten irradians TaxID=31199 RepID=UPI0037244C70
MTSIKETCLVLLVMVLMSHLVDSRLVLSSDPGCENLLPERCTNDTLPTRCLFDPSVGRLQSGCAESDLITDDCTTVSVNSKTQSFTCPGKRVLVGTDSMQPVCCELAAGFDLTECFDQNILYSFLLGFDFQVPDGYALVGKFLYGECEQDLSVFRMRICKLSPLPAWK